LYPVVSFLIINQPTGPSPPQHKIRAGQEAVQILGLQEKYPIKCTSFSLLSCDY